MSSSLKTRLEKLEEKQSPKINSEEWERARVFARTFGLAPTDFIQKDGTCVRLVDLIAGPPCSDSSGGNRDDA